MMRALRNVLVILAVVAMMLAVVPAASADPPGDPDRLNGSLPSGAGRFTGFRISPDGRTVVYQVDQDTTNVYELYSVPVGGGKPTKISGRRVEGGGVPRPDEFRGGRLGFKISPDSARVVYVAEQDTDGVRELYSVPISGGRVVKLNGRMTTGGDVDPDGVAVSPDSSTVVYRADQDTNGTRELYSVPITGGTPVKLNGPFDEGGKVTGGLQGLRISPDSSTVVYRANLDDSGTTELFSVPIDGGTPVKLNGEIAEGGNVKPTWAISSDSSTVVYQADQDTDEVEELYSVPIGGGTPIKLNETMARRGDVKKSQVSPDSSRVVYVADQDTDKVQELFSVPIGGGTVTKLNRPLRGNVRWGFEFAPDSSRVVYASWPDGLYSVPIEGGKSTRLSDGGVGNVAVDSIEISPDSSTVVYVADEDIEGVSELYAVPIGGGSSRKVSGRMTRGGGVEWYLDSPWVADEGSGSAPTISPDSSRVVYLADQDTNDLTEVYSAPIGAGTPVKLNGPLSRSGQTRRPPLRFAVSANSSRVVYLADQTGNGAYDVFSVLISHRCRGEFATVVGTTGTDNIKGSSGPDVIVGLGGDDTIRGRGGADLICGGRGNDTISGNKGADVIYGGKGADTIRGNSGKDTLYGGSGRDVLEGGKRGDTLYGRSGNDLLRGNSGNDELRGGKGTDTCRGGPGQNTKFSCEN